MRLSEALGTLAIAGDFATGRPRGAGMTGSVVSTALTRSLGLGEKAAAAAYYTSLFRFIGCTATGPEAGNAALGDDQGFSLCFLLCDWLDLDALEASLEEGVALHATPEERAAAIKSILGMEAAFPDVVAAHCEQSKIFAARLPLPAEVAPCLPHLYSRWDGKLGGIAGEDIPAPARAVSIGHVAELYRLLKGKEVAQEEIAKRAGYHLDPRMCAHLLTHWDEVFDSLNGGAEFDVFVDAEPGEPVLVSQDHCEGLAMIGADIVDQKAEWMGGHSRRVSALAGRAGQIAGLKGDALKGLRHSALVHDLGKCAVSNRLLNKSEELTHTERLEFESHPYQTEYMLSHGTLFRGLGGLPSCAEERLDGSGYHRRVSHKGLAENLLAAANAYDELVFDRPGRPALSATAAAEQLTQDAKDGAFLAAAVAAVLQASGSPTRAARKALPFGLSRREAQVIACLARSETTNQIAARLGISAKTADHHIQSIYSKTGVRGRVAIALFAIEHGLGSDEKELVWDVVKRKWFGK